MPAASGARVQSRNFCASALFFDDAISAEASSSKPAPDAGITIVIGGRVERCGATAAGWIDGIGYIGGILSGNLIGSIAQHQGWSPAFRFLALTATMSCLVALVYMWRERRKYGVPV